MRRRDPTHQSTERQLATRTTPTSHTNDSTRLHAHSVVRPLRLPLIDPLGEILAVSAGFCRERLERCSVDAEVAEFADGFHESNCRLDVRDLLVE